MSKLIPFTSSAAKGKAGKSGETALGLIYNFLNEPQLRAMSDLSIGGTFPIKSFHLNKKCYAKQFWFCYAGKNTKPQQRVFLALEDSWKGWPRNLTEDQIPTVPESKTLVRPAVPFTFDDKNYDRKKISDVSDFIFNHADAQKSIKNISSKEVIQGGKDFVKAFGGKDKGYCRYPLGYFENFELETKRLYIDEFLAQGEIVYVRYYFGLDKSYPSNKIRIVLFPIADDKKMMSLKDGDGDGGMLEASWPPPPPKVTT